MKINFKNLALLLTLTMTKYFFKYQSVKLNRELSELKCELQYKKKSGFTKLNQIRNFYIQRLNLKFKENN